MIGVLADAQANDAPTVRVAGGERWTIAGPLTFATAAAALAATRALPLPAGGVVDCGAIGVVDSAAVAVLLALKRRAEGERRPLAFVELPPPLALLAELYGVREMLAA